METSHLCVRGWKLLGKLRSSRKIGKPTHSVISKAQQESSTHPEAISISDMSMRLFQTLPKKLRRYMTQSMRWRREQGLRFWPTLELAILWWDFFRVTCHWLACREPAPDTLLLQEASFHLWSCTAQLRFWKFWCSLQSYWPGKFKETQSFQMWDQVSIWTIFGFLCFLSIFGCFLACCLVLSSPWRMWPTPPDPIKRLRWVNAETIDVHIRYLYIHVSVKGTTACTCDQYWHVADVSNARLSRESGRLKILFRLPNLQRSYFVLYRGSVWPRSEGRKVFKTKALKTLQKCQGG